jgi:hypothetical protein
MDFASVVWLILWPWAAEAAQTSFRIRMSILLRVCVPSSVPDSLIIDIYYIIVRIQQHCFHIYLACQGHSPWTSSSSLV